jgi:hypothetical protein
VVALHLRIKMFVDLKGLTGKKKAHNFNFEDEDLTS